MPLGKLVADSPNVEHGVAVKPGGEFESVHLDMIVLSAGLLADLSAEDGYVFLCSERFLVVDEQEVTHLLKVEHHVTGIFFMNGTTLHDTGQVEGIVHIARFQYPPQMLVEPSGIFHRIVVVDRLTCHLLLPNLYRLLLPLLMVVGGVGHQLTVVVHTLKNVFLVGSLIELGQLLFQPVVQPTFRPCLPDDVLDVIHELGILTAVQRIINLS